MASVAINMDENSIRGDHTESSMIDSRLHECVRLDDIEAFKSRVQTNLAEKLVTPCGNTLLHVAVSYGSDKITSYLAEEFPSLITTQNTQQDTVLHLAARRGTYSDAIKSLVDSNPSVARMTNEKGNTPLHDAVIKGNRELAKFLVSIDPEVAYYNNKNGRSPLYLAVENGNKNGILDDLLKSGASIPIYREDGDALPNGKLPVHAAIERRDKDILERIEKAKPELLRLTDEELGNSLHYASSMGFLEGVKLLLNKFLNGAYERNSEGNYPIHIACENDSVGVVKEYLDRFPYPEEFLNMKGQNILHVAAKYGNCFVISYILKQDPKLVEPLLNEMDEDGNTPLHLAAGYGKSLAAFVLVRDQRVEHFTVNHRNRTPYDLAADISQVADEQYENTDEMTAVERRQFDSKNNTPADEIKGKKADSENIAVDYFGASAGERKQNDSKNNTPADEIKGNKADSEKIAIDYFGSVMTLAILYFHACPKKPLSELFPVIQRPMPIRGQEVKSLIGNLLVAAVLVAGLTFAGAIQLPQLRDNINPGDIHHELNSTSRISSHENLLYYYLACDVGAFSTSLVAALILLGATFNYPKFQIAAVVFSTSLVYWAIVMMFEALACSLDMALLGSHDWILSVISTTLTVTDVMLVLAYVLLNFPWINPFPRSQIRLQQLLHCFYYIYFFLSIYSIWWLAHKLIDLRRN